LAVFLAAVAAFFAVFLAATKRSSLDSPGPGKAGLYSLPDPQQQPRPPAPFSPGVKAPLEAVRRTRTALRGTEPGQHPKVLVPVAGHRRHATNGPSCTNAAFMPTGIR
jgi:hypothetical protein